MRTREEIKKLQIQAWDTNDESIKELIIVDLLLDIRDLLAKEDK